MPRIASFDLFAVEFPFRKPFRHAAAARQSSSSLLLQCRTDTGVSGFGECLPREYVTGESVDTTFRLLTETILPRLVGRSFASLSETMAFLSECDGKAPSDWLSPNTAQTAAWAAVDLALLDTFGKASAMPIRLGPSATLPAGFRYSFVSSAAKGIRTWKSLAAYRLLGFRQIKLKVDTTSAEQTVRRARFIMGRHCDLRVDANMAWSLSQSIDTMCRLARYGVQSFEQPLMAGDLDGLATLVQQTGLGIMADESLHDAESLEALIRRQACTAINARISKCGGLMATFNRCQRALDAGLTVQVGAQVGETSLLSAAQLILIAAVENVRYGEGCYGHHLLQEDPFSPRIQFGRGGCPPPLPTGPGLGVTIQEKVLNRGCVRKQTID